MAITTVHTINSVYEIDQDSHRMRRASSSHSPTANQTRYGEDGDWATYIELAWLGGRLLITWSVDNGAARQKKGGQVVQRRTATSQVTSVDGPPIVPWHQTA